MSSKQRVLEPYSRGMPRGGVRLGELLRAARIQRGLTQRCLAELCGLSAKTISLYERSLRHPSWTALQLVLQNLGFRLLLQPVEETMPASQELVAVLRKLSPDLRRLSALLAEVDKSSHETVRKPGMEITE